MVEFLTFLTGNALPATAEGQSQKQFGFLGGSYFPDEALMTGLAIIVPVVFAIAWLLSRSLKGDEE
ncbi:MAG: hypothetical protein AAFR32_09950 [Pseudomonadota bacterium]